MMKRHPATPLIPDTPVGADVYGPESEATTLPMAAIEAPSMTPPELATFATAPAALMDWWAGPKEVEGFSAHWFRTRELTVYYVEGPDNGPPLLLFPGQKEPWHSYEAALPLLTERFHVYIMELRGHGFSERSRPGRYRVVDYVDDAIDLVDHVIGQSAFVSGHSLGGEMVLAMYQRAPDRMLGASIEDAPLFFMDEGHLVGEELEKVGFGPRRTAARARQEGRVSIAGAMRHIANAPMFALPGSITTEANRQSFYDWLQENTPMAMLLDAMIEADRDYYLEGWERYIKEGESPPTRCMMPYAFLEPMRESNFLTDWRTSYPQATHEWLEGFDEREALASLALPTVLWYSDQSIAPRVPEDLEESERLVKTVDRPCRVIEAKGCAHYIHREQPALFADTLAEMFLA